MRRFLVLLALSGCSKAKTSDPAPAPPPTASAPLAPTSPPTPAPASPPAATAAPAGDDLFSIATGAMVVRGAEGTEPLSAAWYLFDEDPTTGFTAAKDQIAATPPVLELPVRARIDRIIVDAANLDLDERLPTKLVVEMSDESATTGFQPIAETALALPNRDNVEVQLTGHHPGRWVRVVPTGRAGGSDQTQLMELRGYGERLAPPPVLDATGTYETDQGWFHLTQTGAIVTGCFEHGTAPFLGGVEGRLVKFQFDAGEPAARGPAIMTIGANGQVFGGYYASTENSPHPVLSPILGKRTATTPGPCPAAKHEDPIATALAHDGHVRLPGINFDSDSDHLRDESKATLDRVVAILKAGDLAVTIDGHTDSTSTPDHNQTLSERRAAAVKAYLVAAGIPAARLASRGFGQSQPIAPNTSAFGRAQNRRVELARK